MWIEQLEAQYPEAFRPLVALSDYTSWSARGLHSRLLTVFPRLLTVDELIEQVDEATPAVRAGYRQSVRDFVHQLACMSAVYSASPFADRADRLLPERVDEDTVIRLAERCDLNLLLPEWRVAVRGGDDFSMNVVHVEPIDEALLTLGKRCGLFWL